MQKSGDNEDQLSPIANINNQTLERQQCSEEDPQTQNDDMEMQYTEPDQKESFNESSPYENQEEFVQKLSKRKRKDLEDEQSMDRTGKFTKEMSQIQIQRRKNRRNESKITPEYNTVQRLGYPLHSMVQSSTDSLFITPNLLNSPTKNTKLSRKQSLTSESTQFYDSRKNIASPQTSSTQSQPCFQISTQRIITFFLIYQIVVVFFLTVSSIEQQYLNMIEATIILVVPSYFGVRCIWVASRGQRDNQYIIKEEVSQNDSQIIADKQTRKIHNSYYLQNKEMPDNLPHNQKKPQKKSSKIYPITNKNQQISRVSFMSIIPQPAPKKYLLTVPYMHNNQLQHIQKCTKCPSPHTNTRIKHCNKCDVCHFGYDHYCLWLGVCVDLRNYGYFVWFVGILWVIGLALFILTAVFSWRWSHHHQIQARIQRSSYFVLGIWCLSALENLLGLIFCTYVLFYHIWLNYIGVSTRQHFAGNIQNPNNNLFCKSLRHSITQQYPTFFLKDLNKQLFQSEPSATIIQQQPKP